jgi:hypothetical protein
MAVTGPGRSATLLRPENPLTSRTARSSDKVTSAMRSGTSWMKSVITTRDRWAFGTEWAW